MPKTGYRRRKVKGREGEGKRKIEGRRNSRARLTVGDSSAYPEVR